MKKALTLLLLLSLLLSGCKTAPKPEKPEPVPETVLDLSQLQLIHSPSAVQTWRNLSQQFCQEFSRRTGLTFDLQSDEETFPLELLIGKTNRPLTAELSTALDKAGGQRFGISVTADAVAVLGTDVYQTYLGLEYLMTTYLKGTTLALPQGLYISPENESLIGDQLAGDVIKDLVAQGQTPYLFPDKAVTYTPNEGDYRGTQGCGTDGTYAYVAKLNRTQKNPERGKLYKYRLDTWELVAVSESLPTNHSNDITYNPELGLLVVVGASGSGNWLGGRAVNFIDPETLTLVNSVIAPQYLRGLEYDAASGGYIAAGDNYYFHKVDKDFNILTTFRCQYPTYTQQGIHSDGTYLYDPRFSGIESILQPVMVYSVDGEYIATVQTHEMLGSEPESLFIHNGKFYIGCGGTHVIWEAELLPSAFWPADN